jgi:hypothetical protein
MVLLILAFHTQYQQIGGIMFSKFRALSTKLVFGVIISFFAAQSIAAGALAIDSNTGKQYGFASGYQSTNQAEQRAMQECGSGCQVVLRFNGCGAYAADQSRGSTAYGWAHASNGPTAQSLALSKCQAQGGSASSCKIRSWGCD